MKSYELCRDYGASCPVVRPTDVLPLSDHAAFFGWVICLGFLVVACWWARDLARKIRADER